MKNKYDVDYFIEKFEATKEEDWCVNALGKNIDVPIVVNKFFLGGLISYTKKDMGIKNVFCAQGHCLGISGIEFLSEQREKMKTNPELTEYKVSKGIPEWNALLDLFGGEEQTKEGMKGQKKIADINNGNDPDYQQPTARARVLQALYDIKAKQAKPEGILSSEELITALPKITLN